MTKDEVLKLALEALEEAADAIDSWGSYASGYFQVKHDLENDISKARKAITAIKEALSKNEFNPDWNTQAVLVEEMQRMAKHIEELEAQQEPVAVYEGYLVGSELCQRLGVIKKSKFIPLGTLLYTTPPQRKPLSDEEIALIVAECASSAHRHDDFSFARAIEAAHGIKGEA